MGGVTTVGTGGSRYLVGIAVTLCLDFTGFNMITVGAITLLTALFGAGGCLGDLPGTHLMTGSIHVGIHVAVAAGAGVGGVTTVGTGRSGNFRLVIMGYSSAF